MIFNVFCLPLLPLTVARWSSTSFAVASGWARSNSMKGKVSMLVFFKQAGYVLFPRIFLNISYTFNKLYYFRC